MGILGMIATKYGKVLSGPHAGLQVGFGNDSGKIFGGGTNQIVFWEGTKERERVHFSQIESCTFEQLSDTSAKLTINWGSGDVSIIQITKEFSYIATALKQFLK